MEQERPRADAKKDFEDAELSAEVDNSCGLLFADISVQQIEVEVGANQAVTNTVKSK